MAIGDAYASVEDYKAITNKSSTADDLWVGRALLAFSRYIDHKLDRRSGFNKDTVATIRLYMPRSTRPTRTDWAESENPWLYGGRSRVLDVQDIGGAITSITIDETKTGAYSLTLASTDYELLPLNAAVGPEPRPYKQIGLLEWGGHPTWTPGARVKVTAIHGWPAVPQAIKLATIEMTAILRVESPFAADRIQEFDQVVNASPQARGILNSLMTNYSAGVYV
jgi:hypothetical protein